MQQSIATQPNVLNSINLSYYDDPRLSDREIREIVDSVKRNGKVSLWEIGMVYGSSNGLFTSGELVEENGFAVLAVVEVHNVEVDSLEIVSPEAPAAKLTIDEQLSHTTASQNTVSQRPTWIDLHARREIANRLVEFVLAELPSLTKLGKKEIAQLNGLMPANLASDVILTGLTRSTRGITWGEPRKCLHIKFTYFTGMADTRLVETEEEAPVAEEVTVAVEPAPAVEPTPAATITIDEQIAELKATGDSAYIQAANLYSDCLNGDWLEQLVREDEANLEAERAALEQYHKELALEGQILMIEGLKLKNIDRRDNYWLFVGNYDQCEAAQQALLHDHLVRSVLKPNSKNGESWKLIVDRFARGFIETAHLRELVEQQQVHRFIA